MTSSSVPVVIDGRTLPKAQPPDLMRSDLMLASFFLVGFALLLLAIAGLSALRAEGEVLELRGTSSPIARVRFTDAQGLEHIADTSGPFNGVHAEAGERIVILYQPGSPTYASHDDPARNWIGTAIFAGGGCLPLLLIPFMRRQLRRQEQRYARLRQLGYRRQVESVRTQPVQLGKVRRWAVIASWRDSLGRPQETIAGPYSYDPAPLDPAVLVVLADPQTPEQSVLAPETLPAFSRPWRPVRSAGTGS
ncbi:MAG: hypothetical protein R3F10_08370 [Lysobacteraceae bacterium]